MPYVKVMATHTAKVPNTSPTAASSGSDINGMAALDAAMAIRNRIAAFAAERYQVDAAHVSFRDDTVIVGNEVIPFPEMVEAAYRARVHLSSTGFYATPKLHWDRDKGHGRPFFYFAYGAACAEVLIDTTTGELRVLRTDLLHDVGRSLNPAIDIGQIEGGFVQGMGWLTTEELVHDEKGRLLTHAPSTYKIPVASDVPRDLRVALFENASREDTIHRSKAVGEPPLMLSISVFSAIVDALHGLAPGVHVSLDAPATPERVLMAADAMRVARKS
jgi:xanthine dehydrogenase large subunit